MDETTATWVDRTGWESGPWDDEPDRVEWRHRGVPCLVLRGPQGSLCGYAAVPESHPWFEAGYNDYDRLGPAHDAAHGGLTFASACVEDERPAEQRICHVPREGETDAVWWLGFDCAHAWDRTPGSEAWYRQLAADALARGDRETADVFGRIHLDHDRIYRRLAYVRGRVEALAEAIIEAAL